MPTDWSDDGLTPKRVARVNARYFIKNNVVLTVVK
jgi:hypothetical protein